MDKNASRSASHPRARSPIIRLSVEDQRRFVELLLHPPDLAPAMKRAQQAHAKLIESR